MRLPSLFIPLTFLSLTVDLSVLNLSRSCRAEFNVAWLGDVQHPPTQPVLSEAGSIEPLLVNDKNQPIRDLNGWKDHRESLRKKWLSLLGPMPAAPVNDDISIVRDNSPPDCLRHLVRYECEPGLFVEAYLLRSTDPKFTGPRPGLVALHQTTNSTIDEIAGLSGPESLQLDLKLARRGFVVICPKCFLWQDAKSLQNAVEQFRIRHPETVGMRKMLYDAQRAVDILIAQPNVDAKRVGAVGHSLGAKEALYLAAFDERIRATVASEGGLTFKSTNWDAPWYLGPAIKQTNFQRNHHELLALTAPRAMLILAGENGPGAADGDRSWPLIEAAMPVYRLYDAHPKIGLLNHKQGHSISPESFERLAEWLEVYTAPEMKPLPQNNDNSE